MTCFRMRQVLSEAVFEGTIAGEPVQSNLFYMGRSEPGGHISGRFVFSRGVEGRLEVDSQRAVGVSMTAWSS